MHDDLGPAGQRSFTRDPRHAERDERRTVGPHRALDRDLRIEDVDRIVDQGRIHQVLDEQPRPCGHGRRRDAARVYDRDAVGLPREVRKEPHLERPIGRDALHDQRAPRAALDEVDALELGIGRAPQDLLAHVGHLAHLGAQAARDEARQWIGDGLLSHTGPRRSPGSPGRRRVRSAREGRARSSAPGSAPGAHPRGARAVAGRGA